jgi:hypothetical protein
VSRRDETKCYEMRTDDLRLRAMILGKFLTWIAELKHNFNVLAETRV